MPPSRISSRDVIRYRRRCKELNVKLNLQDLASDTTWLQRQVAKGRMNPLMLDFIPKLQEAAETAYPGRWQIHFELEVAEETHINEYRLIQFNHDYYANYVARYGIDAVEGMEDQEISRAYSALENDCDAWHIPHRYILNVHYKFSNAKLIIHYPEFEIKNDRGHKHTIRNFFICLPFNASGEVQLNMQGMRTTLTSLEAEANYMHSHLPSIKTKRGYEDQRLFWQAFCKGGGPLVTSFNIYNASKDKHDLLSILYGLNNVVRLESLKGGPHTTMDCVMGINEDMVELRNDDIKMHYRALLARINKSLFQVRDTNGALTYPEIDWTYSNGVYKITDNDKFNDFCVHYLNVDEDIRINDGGAPGHVIVYKRPNGQYFRKDSRFNANNYTPTDKYFPFRGTKFFFEVIDIRTSTNESKKFIHPQIREHVKQQLESMAKKAAVKQAAIERLNQD